MRHAEFFRHGIVGWAPGDSMGFAVADRNQSGAVIVLGVTWQQVETGRFKGKVDLHRPKSDSPWGNHMMTIRVAELVTRTCGQMKLADGDKAHFASQQASARCASQGLRKVEVEMKENVEQALARHGGRNSEKLKEQALAWHGALKRRIFVKTLTGKTITLNVGGQDRPQIGSFPLVLVQDYNRELNLSGVSYHEVDAGAQLCLLQ